MRRKAKKTRPPKHRARDLRLAEGSFVRRRENVRVCVCDDGRTEWIDDDAEGRD